MADQIFDSHIRNEAWIKLNQRVGPEVTFGIGFIRKFLNIFGSDGTETAGKALIVLNKLLSKLEDIHEDSPTLEP